MSATEEAYLLIQQQPEANILAVIDFMRKISPQRAVKAKTFKRTGIGNHKFKLSSDFDQHFDAMDAEVAEDFYQVAV